MERSARSLMVPSRLILPTRPGEGLAPAIGKEVMDLLGRPDLGNVSMVSLSSITRYLLPLFDRAYVRSNVQVAYEGTPRRSKPTQAPGAPPRPWCTKPDGGLNPRRRVRARVSSRSRPLTRPSPPWGRWGEKIERLTSTALRRGVVQPDAQRRLFEWFRLPTTIRSRLGACGYIFPTPPLARQGRRHAAYRSRTTTHSEPVPERAAVACHRHERRRFRQADHCHRQPFTQFVPGSTSTLRSRPAVEAVRSRRQAGRQVVSTLIGR